jgi:perosamine synthetase
MIEHNRPYIDKDDKDFVLSNLEPELLSGGQTVSEFEKMFCKIFGQKDAEACAVSSGTSALFMALQALGIKKGQKVIIPTYVCSGVLNAIFMLGAEPVLSDVNEDDFNISLDGVRKLISSKVKAIVIPHIYGVPADIDEFKRFGLPIVEDCAQAIGAKCRSKYTGTFGDIAIFSFYATKLITTGHGGMVYSRNRKLIGNVLDYREFDCRKRYYPRFNFKMTDFQAALGISQLKKLNYFIKRRNTIAKKYIEAIQAKKYFKLQKVSQDNVSAYYRFVIRKDKGIKHLQKYFLLRGIKTIVPIEPYELLHRYLKQDKRHFKCAENIAKITLSIPLYPALKDRDIEIISQALKEL